MAGEKEPHGGEKQKAKPFELPEVGKSEGLEVPSRGVTLLLQNEREEEQVGPAVVFTADYPYVLERDGRSYSIFKPQNDLVRGSAFHATVIWDESPEVKLRPMAVVEAQKIYDERSQAYIQVREELRLIQEEIVRLEAQQALYGELARDSGGNSARQATDFETKLRRLGYSLGDKQKAVATQEKAFHDAGEALACVSVNHAKKMLRDSTEEYTKAKQRQSLADQQAAKAQAQVLGLELDRSRAPRDEAKEEEAKRQESEALALLKKENQNLRTAEWRLHNAENLLEKAKNAGAKRKFYVGTLRTPEL
ncbi:MAG: hypothetical protein AAB588_01515 [Patescibacteria group bacterium]